MEAASTLPVWNRQKALANADDDPQLWQELLEIWDTQRDPLTAGLHCALETGDLRAGAMAAHTLKGSFTVLAAERAQAAAWNLEQKLQSGDGFVGLEVDQLLEEIEELQAALRTASHETPTNAKRNLFEVGP